jgi:hypothetical protein
LIKKQKKPRIDNVPIESAVVSTKVKVPPSSEPKTSGHKAKPQTIKRAQKTGKPVVKVADKRNYNSGPPAPRFIIKQAGTTIVISFVSNLYHWFPCFLGPFYSLWFGFMARCFGLT